MFFLMISRPGSNLGHVESETRSPGQIKEKPCGHSRGHVFHWIFMKIDMHVLLDDFLLKFESR